MGSKLTIKSLLVTGQPSAFVGVKVSVTLPDVSASIPRYTVLRLFRSSKVPPPEVVHIAAPVCGEVPVIVTSGFPEQTV